MPQTRKKAKPSLTSNQKLGVVLIIPLLAGLAGYLTYYPVAINKERGDFAQSKSSIEELSQKIRAEIKEPDHIEVDESGGREIRKINYDEDLANNVVFRGGTWNVAVKGGEYALMTSAPYRLFVRSEPRLLGEVETDDEGSLSAHVTIPDDMPTGFHTLSVEGENIVGDQTAIYKVVYVAHSADDYNGNGIPNELDACIVAEPSGQDEDQDGIDDACDGHIGEPPEEESGVIGLPGFGNPGTGDGSKPPEALPGVEQPPEAERPSEPAKPQTSSVFTIKPSYVAYSSVNGEADEPAVAGASSPDLSAPRLSSALKPPETPQNFAIIGTEPNRLLIGIVCLTAVLAAGLGISKTRKSRKP